MRLKKIKLAGFKSFVDPTTIQFPTNLVGIVGPNGCGKSNTIDAVRWVMGESSAKTLRGDSMADVIFNGSSSRKPVGQAHVELIFDNSDASLGGQYAQYSEIAIKRQVSRDGQSSYFLNGTKCRRRDITDIFLGTGLGPRSYAIIEQGMISRLIEAKPEDLRIYIEEAAGISKYKERRRETENRMRHTRENLERLNDLRDEVGKQLQHLQRQARTAERYKELKEEERRTKAELYALRWRSLEQNDQNQDRAIREKETALEGIIAEQRAIEAQIETLREAHIEASDTFNEVQGRYYAAGAEISRVETSIQHAKDMAHQRNQELQQIEQALQEAQRHAENDLRQLQEIDAELEANEPAMEALRETEAVSAERLQETEGTMAAWQNEWEAFSRDAAEPTQIAQVERARIDQLDRQTVQIKQRIARFEEELGRLDSSQVDTEIEELAEAEALLDETLHTRQLRLEELKATLIDNRQSHQIKSEELDRMRGDVQRLKGRQASLEALQQSALGKSGAQTGDWLKRQGLEGAARLAERMRVNPGWEVAVETVLGATLEAICTNRLDDLIQDAAQFESGRLELLAQEGDVAPGDAGARLADRVQLNGIACPPELYSVQTASDLTEALAVRDRLTPGESVITPEGVWLGRGWIRVQRGADEKSGVLQREQELKGVIEELDGLTEATSRLEEETQQLRVALQDLEQERDQLQSEVNNETRQLADIRSRLSGKRTRVEQLSARGTQIRDEIEELNQQNLQSEEEIVAARGRLHEALAQMEEYAQKRDELNARRDEIRASLELVREEARQDREQSHQLALRLESLRSRRQSLEQNQGRIDGQLEQLAERKMALVENMAQSGDPVKELEAQLEEYLEARVRVEAELGEARGRVEQLEQEIRQGEQRRHTLEQRVHEIHRELERVRLTHQELQVRKETLEDQLRETGFALEALLEELGGDADEQVWRQRVEDLGQKIQRLGPINLAAIEEYAEQAERMQYLDSQYEDLNESLQTLENAIVKIDRETRTRFRETFDRVDKGFQTLFPRLFGGGHAYLQLTGNDLLDTGVTVMARPPGKRNSTIHLLSGGEKALTAVSLVFSIFQLNPAPFCMLDEVDAPLDEANVGRFCRMVEEMSKTVQFIFITHNKGTMELSNQLMGVTMHEPGVSRIVDVDMDAAVEMAAVG